MRLSKRRGQVTHVLLTRSPLSPKHKSALDPVRLACVKHAASVRPEPGSNSPNKNKTEKNQTNQKSQPSDPNQKNKNKTKKDKTKNTLSSSQTTPTQSLFSPFGLSHEPKHFVKTAKGVEKGSVSTTCFVAEPRIYSSRFRTPCQLTFCDPHYLVVHPIGSLRSGPKPN